MLLYELFPLKPTQVWYLWHQWYFMGSTMFWQSHLSSRTRAITTCSKTVGRRREWSRGVCVGVRPDKSNSHVVPGATLRHYECVQYDELQVFPSGHELIERLMLLSVSHPPAAAAVEHDQEQRCFSQLGNSRRTCSGQGACVCSSMA